VPARVIGEHAGGLVAGAPADVTVVDDNLAVERVLVGGRERVVA
jgi:N-acetylglucosamine-6-phosphate deacetylase